MDERFGVIWEERMGEVEDFSGGLGMEREMNGFPLSSGTFWRPCHIMLRSWPCGLARFLFMSFNLRVWKSCDVIRQKTHRDALYSVLNKLSCAGSSKQDPSVVRR